MDEPDWHLRWHSICVYYIVACIITLAGLMCFYGIARHPFGKQMFEHKDQELRNMDEATTPTSINVSTRQQETPFAQSRLTAVCCFVLVSGDRLGPDQRVCPGRECICSVLLDCFLV